MSIRAVVKRNAVGIGAILVAAPAIGFGFVSLLTYAHTPGPAGTSPSSWPHDSTLQRTNDRPTLLVFAHPECPCTNATINELARIMAQHHQQVDAAVVFARPEVSPPTWTNNRSAELAAGIPGVRAVDDRGGVETHAFGAVTSGQTLLFDRGGRLVFSGGITASRGHEGDNDGRDAIERILTRGGEQRSSTPVFGCILTESR